MRPEKPCTANTSIPSPPTGQAMATASRASSSLPPPGPHPDEATKPEERPMSMSAIAVNNGVNVEALMGAREALAKAPEAAQFRWQATCDWMNGTHSRATVSNFFGLGQD